MPSGLARPLAAMAPAALGLVLVSGLLLLPVRSGDQAVYAGSFGLAVACMWIWGRGFARYALGMDKLGVVTSVYLGQFALLAAAAPLSVLNGVVALLSGRSLPLVMVVIPLTLVVLVVLITGRSAVPPQLNQLSPFALLSLASGSAVMAAYSSHIASLSLDIHEHTVWVHQIISQGRVSLSEPGTRILSDYPRTFHLLAALWTAGGLAPPVGPYVKLMPFLQNALPVLAVGETLAALISRNNPTRQRVSEVVLGLAAYLYNFYFVPMAYPSAELYGTPRFSSNGVLLLPVVLALVGHARHSSRATWASLLVLPLVAVWALTWNPIILVILGVLTLPTVLLCRWLLPTVSERRRQGRAVVWTATLSLAISVTAAVQDPWFTTQLVKRVPASGSVLRGFGVLTYDEAVQQGLATERHFWNKPGGPIPPCRGLRCRLGLADRALHESVDFELGVARMAARNVTDLLREPSNTRARLALVEAFPFRMAPIQPKAALPYFGLIALAGLYVVTRATREKLAGNSAWESPGRFWLAALLGLGIGGIGLSFAASLAEALDDHTHDGWLLSVYLGGAGAHVGLSWLWLPLGAACAALARPMLAKGLWLSANEWAERAPYLTGGVGGSGHSVTGSELLSISRWPSSQDQEADLGRVPEQAFGWEPGIADLALTTTANPGSIAIARDAPILERHGIAAGLYGEPVGKHLGGEPGGHATGSLATGAGAGAVTNPLLGASPSHTPLTVRANELLGEPAVVRDSRQWSAVAQQLASLAGLILWISLPLHLGVDNLKAGAARSGTWGPTSLRDAAALRRVESAIPRRDGVIVPSAHLMINAENWIYPIGPTAPLLESGNRRYLFDVQLGAGYPLGWRDLAEKFCSSDPAVRRSFLARVDAHWILARDPDARDSLQAAEHQTECGIPIKNFVELPAVRSDGGVFLYRLNPSPTPVVISPTPPLPDL